MEIVFGLIGGLAIFIFGMQFMSDGLKNAAGDQMQSILEKLTGNRILGVFIGALVTAIIQSSSATTVMVVGFVNAAMLNLSQAIAVIIGANIGTTITAQIVSFKISEFILPIIIVGFGMNFLARKARWKYIGAVILGFGLLMHGMDIMSSSMKPLQQVPAFKEIMLSFAEHPWLGLLAGLGATVLVQSSSATTGILIAMASSGLITLDSALPILFGTNIGTCITAVLSSIGTTRNAKRAALAHVLFNLLGSLVFMMLLNPYESLVTLISGESAGVPRLVANAHTLFNVTNALIFIPFIGRFSGAIYRIIPEHDEERELSTKSRFLDERMLSTPEIAFSLAKKEILAIGQMSRKNYRNSVNGLMSKNPKKLRKVFELEPVIDKLIKQTTLYLTRISQQSISSHLSMQNTAMLHTAYDIERIGDHAENIAQIAQGYLDGRFVFSEMAQKELEEMFQLTMDCIDTALDALENSDGQLAEKVNVLEKEINRRERDLRRQHTERLREGTCVAEAGIAFLDILTNMERVGDHCQNIAESVLETA